MKKNVLAFAGSNHAKSINYQLLSFTAGLLEDHEVRVLDIRNWDVPIYSINMDPDQTPEQITELIGLIQDADGILIASPEHNGATPAFFKNILDWVSRRSKKVFTDKSVFVLSTSPGPGGAATNLAFLAKSLPFQGASVAATFSLPSFYDNFKDGAMQGEQLEKLQEKTDVFSKTLNG
ncbi:MAG: NADPH-dependent FMN reductase [Bacteroidota bacterium]